MSLTRGLVLDVANQLGGATPGAVTLHDFSREKNDGTINSGTWLQLSTGQWTLSFPGGAGSNIFFPNADSLEIVGSLECWLYRDTNVANYYLFDGRGGGGAYCWFLAGANNLVSAGTEYVDGTAGAAVSLLTWHHIVITNMTICGTTGGLYLMATLGGGGGQPGDITCVRIYNYDLSPAQIRARYHSKRWLFGDPT